MDQLILALLPLLAQVESNNDPAAIGDNGKAIGIYQIWEPYWQDGCEELDVEWPYEWAYKPDKARFIVFAYLYRYGRAYERETKKPVTLEVLARIHNGGPDGWKKEATKKYWLKIKEAQK